MHLVLVVFVLVRSRRIHVHVYRMQMLMEITFNLWSVSAYLRLLRARFFTKTTNLSILGKLN